MKANELTSGESRLTLHSKGEMGDSGPPGMTETVLIAGEGPNLARATGAAAPAAGATAAISKLRAALNKNVPLTQQACLGLPYARVMTWMRLSVDGS
jgi:hypothetical protein